MLDDQIQGNAKEKKTTTTTNQILCRYWQNIASRIAWDVDLLYSVRKCWIAWMLHNVYIYVTHLRKITKGTKNASSPIRDRINWIYICTWKTLFIQKSTQLCTQLLFIYKCYIIKNSMCACGKPIDEYRCYFTCVNYADIRYTLFSEIFQIVNYIILRHCMPLKS